MMDAAMYCHACGGQIPAGSAYCSHCGVAQGNAPSHHAGMSSAVVALLLVLIAAGLTSTAVSLAAKAPAGVSEKRKVEPTAALPSSFLKVP